MAYHFIDAAGIDWMVIPGLPADHLAANDSNPFCGITFRASTGEVRVLPRDRMKRPTSAEIEVASLGSGSRVAMHSQDWEALLAQATPWR